MGFSRQEYWGGLPFPTPGDLPYSEIEPMSLASPTLTGRFFSTVPPRNLKALSRSVYIRPQKSDWSVSTLRPVIASIEENIEWGEAIGELGFSLMFTC